MSKGQNTNGIYGVLSRPWLYRLFQQAVGANGMRKRLIQDYVQGASIDSLLELGCGTADLLALLPREIKYTGIDASSAYIHFATNRFGTKGEFLTGTFGEGVELSDSRKFDLVLAVGVLHHLDDYAASELMNLSKNVLTPGGRFISVDPAWPTQNRRSVNWILARDRGKAIRTSEGYEELVRTTFDYVQVKSLPDLLRIPYSHCFCVGSNSVT